mmetsp:Transcript_20851/g.42909  ORF Transcript_20851/g.42909 Transcript_20851/m.42909 type:complete len:88 (+) Transcript_20851:32-295(+)
MLGYWIESSNPSSNPSRNQSRNQSGGSQSIQQPIVTSSSDSLLLFSDTRFFQIRGFSLLRGGIFFLFRFFENFFFAWLFREKEEDDW